MIIKCWQNEVLQYILYGRPGINNCPSRTLTLYNAAYWKHSKICSSNKKWNLVSLLSRWSPSYFSLPFCWSSAIHLVFCRALFSSFASQSLSLIFSYTTVVVVVCISRATLFPSIASRSVSQRFAVRSHLARLTFQAKAASTALIRHCQGTKGKCK